MANGMDGCRDPRITGHWHPLRRLQAQAESPWLLGALGHLRAEAHGAPQRFWRSADSAQPNLIKEALEEFLGELPRRRDGGRVCSRQALSQILESRGAWGGRPWVEAAAPRE